jgi:Heparinase II/III N-terminus
MRSVGIVPKRGLLGSGVARAVIAGCLTCAPTISGSNPVAEDLDLGAYDIRAKPEPGPVTQFQPIKSLPPISFELPFDWGMDPYEDRTWRFRLHTLRLLDSALVAGDFDYARDVFLDWQRWHENCWWSWPLCFERAADQSWDDMATGIRASRLAYVLRATGWQDERLIELAEQHALKLRDHAFIADNHNHAIFQLHGLASLCSGEALHACRGARPFIQGELQALLKGQFTAAGVHRENSPEYHFFVTDHLSRLAPLLRPFSPDLDAVLARAKEVEKWLVFPDQTLAQIGDSNLELRSRWRRQLALPSGEARCRNVRSYSEARDCYLIKHFEDAGYVIVRSDWAMPAERASMLFLQGGFFNRTASRRRRLDLRVVRAWSQDPVR